MNRPMGGFNRQRAIEGLFWLIKRDRALILQLGLVWFVLNGFLLLVSQMLFPTSGVVANLGFIVTPFFFASLSHAAVSPDTTTLLEARQVGLARFGQTFLLMLVTNLVMAVGLLALIIPGLVMMVAFLPIYAIDASEDRGVSHAFSRCRDIFVAHGWNIALIMLVATIPVILAILMLSALGTGLLLVSQSLITVLSATVSLYLGAAVYLEATYGGSSDAN